ncbi:MAG: glyoxalase/bleomycin resistance/extradiol dioxygenase family protein [Streptosporangiales bacterium]|nr:glyoxalase/bleomycin resistance/extradiol dioxygenase family protein [Streptosporangiales bacterium]
MPTKIFVNLPVKDLDKSVDFFTKLGYTFDQNFTDENATCMVVADDIYVMLLVEPFFQTFTKKPVADATSTTEVLLGLSADSRQQVDDLVDKALAAGAAEANEANDQGFMYGRSFADLDGHIWEVMWMDMSAVQG